MHMACKEPRFLSALVAVAFAPAPRGSDFLFPIPGACAPGYVSVVLRTLEFRSLRSHQLTSQIAICGGNTIGVLDFSPTFIIKPHHQKGGTEVPPYDIDKLLFEVL